MFKPMGGGELFEMAISTQKRGRIGVEIRIFLTFPDSLFQSDPNRKYCRLYRRMMPKF